MPLVALLKSGSDAAKEHASGALANLANGKDEHQKVPRTFTGPRHPAARGSVPIAYDLGPEPRGRVVFVCVVCVWWWAAGG